MNKDSHLIFEAYRNKLVSEDMPYPTFAKLAKHASPKSSKEKPAGEFKQQMPDSKEEYSAHDYAREMEVKGEGEESLHITKYKHIIDQLAKGAFDTESEQEQVDQGASEGIFDVQVVNGSRQVVLTNAAVKTIGDVYPELKGKFWDCGRCKADYKGCGDAKHHHAENEERRLDPKCWKGYHKAGTKMKDGVRVNNCVKSQSNEEGLVGGQKKLDANHDGEITGADFKLLRRKRLKGEEEQEGPYNYEDVEVKFTHDDVNYIAFGDALYDENDEDYSIENFAIYKMEDLNRKDREEVADKKIRNMAFNAVYNKAIDQSAEDLPHPSLGDPRNYLPRQ